MRAMTDEAVAVRRIRGLLGFFVLALVASGLTAVPLEWEARLLAEHVFALGSTGEAAFPALAAWMRTVAAGLKDASARYPFLLYGTDWLAFAHLVIALAFWGPIRDPVRNVWVVELGLIACALVPVVAHLAGPVRGIPPFWRWIDSAFGIVGFVPLAVCRTLIRRLEASGR